MSIIASEILIVVALFVANGVFAMSEMALVSARKSRLKQSADAGNPGAAAALRLVASPDRFLPTVQLTVLNRFKRSGLHVAVVRTADGRSVGLVTLVDILEAIVGDIPSQEDRLRPEVLKRADGSWLADGQYDVGKLATLLGVTLPLPAADSGATLAAFAGEQLHGHPREGDSFTNAGLRFEVIDMDRTSVDKILIRRDPANCGPHLEKTSNHDNCC